MKHQFRQWIADPDADNSSDDTSRVSKIVISEHKKNITKIAIHITNIERQLDLIKILLKGEK
jgi:hypothetical protein